MKSKAQIIAFEGLDGAGKSSQVDAVFKKLRTNDLPVTKTSDLSATFVGSQIKSILLDKNNNILDAQTQLLLFAAARREHFLQTLIPAIEQDRIILVDRFVDSTLAYQGYGSQLPLSLVQQSIELAVNKLRPHKLIYLDLPPHMVNSRSESDAFTVKGLEYYTRVSRGYDKIVREYYDPEDVLIVDARLDKLAITFQIMEFLNLTPQ